MANRDTPAPLRPAPGAVAWGRGNGRPACLAKQEVPMPPYSDVHVLALERSAVVAERFLDTFSADREQSAADYVFPQYAEQPSVVLMSAAEAIRYCESHR